jgi:5'-3' exonuclease
MTALIDADGIVYIVAYNHRENSSEEAVKESCDTYIRDIMLLTDATDYIGVFSPASFTVFRNEVYRYARYKGNRPEKPDFMGMWENTIKQYFQDKYGFITVPELEADDIVAGAAYALGLDKCIICSPDKDLKQVPTIHYDYKKEGATPEIIDATTATICFWMQMLEGDGSDNIAGVPGLGPVKAKKIINDVIENGSLIQLPSTVCNAYVKYFGAFYGKMIYEETLKAIQLMVPTHPLYKQYDEKMQRALDHRKTMPVKRSGFFDITS